MIQVGKEWIPVFIYVMAQVFLSIWVFATMRSELRTLKDTIRDAAGKEQVRALEEAIVHLKDAVNALIDYKLEVEHRITRIEAKCALFHTPEQKP